MLEWIYWGNHILQVMMQIWDSDSRDVFSEGYKHVERWNNTLTLKPSLISMI